MRRLIPYFEWNEWSGGIDEDSDAGGRSLLIVWLGLCIEICVGRVTRL